MRFSLSFLFGLLLVVTINGRSFKKCELVDELIVQGFELDELPDWICLTLHESSFNTSAIGGPNTNNSFDYGLFQINDNYWCDEGQLSNDCNIECSKFIDDDITDDVECVRLIYARHNFTAWNAWKAHCQDALPDLSECFNDE